MRDRACEMFHHALVESSIPRAFSKHIRRAEDALWIADHPYDLQSFASRRVISIGKAGHTMAEALREIAGGELEGIVACPNAPPAPLPGLRYFTGGHPLPNAQSLQADGTDGNSPAAGALVDGTTVGRATQRGLNAADALAKFDAYALFDALGELHHDRPGRQQCSRPAHYAGLLT